MDELIDVIERVGFPIAVAAWVLIRLNGKMDKLTRAISELRQAIERHLSRDMVRAVIDELEYERAVAENAPSGGGQDACE